MIGKVGSSPASSSPDLQQIAKSNDLDWSRYVQAIEDLKTNPPKKYAVTISQFTWYKDVEFPTWQIPSMIKQGVDPASIPPPHDVRMVVTEPYMKILQAAVPTYLRDIEELDPTTGQPVDPGAGTPCVHTASMAAVLPTSTSTQLAPVSAPQSSSLHAPMPPLPRPRSSTAGAQVKDKEPLSPLEATSIEPTELSPEQRQAALRLAEQFLRDVLRRLDEISQLDTPPSNMLDRTA